MKTRFYLTRENGVAETSIYIRVSFEGSRFKFYPGNLNVNPQYWDKKKQRAKDTPAFLRRKELNSRLAALERDVLKYFERYRHQHNDELPAPKEFKEILECEINGKGGTQQKNFLAFYEEFVRDCRDGKRFGAASGRQLSDYTVKGYKTTLNHLKQFSRIRPIDFGNIDFVFHGDYVAYLTRKNLNKNTIGDHIKRIKAVVREAKKRGYNINPAYSEFGKPSEKTFHIYLTFDELDEMEKLDLSNNPRLKKVRDLFLLGCETGQRHQDWGKLKLADVVDGCIDIEQPKTGQRVSVPLSMRVIRILKEYGGQPLIISSQKTNKYLKEIGYKMPSLHVPAENMKKKNSEGKSYVPLKWEVLTTHVARRSFTTNWFRAGKSAGEIMGVTGHATETQVLRYMKATAREKSASMAKAIKERDSKTYMKAV